MENQFTNPLSLQTVARLKDGSYLYHIASFRDLDKSIAAAKEWATKSNHARKGYYSQVTDPNGTLLFDSRS